MPADEHRAAAPRSVGCAVLTISDTRDFQTDTSGQTIVDLLQQSGHHVLERRITKDEPADVVDTVRSFLARDNVQTIITTGGTGIARRDSTYDTLAAMFERTLPGFGELFRALSYADIGAAAMLTRATAGIIERRAVFLLPGSEHAVRLAMTKLILPEIGHVVRELMRQAALEVFLRPHLFGHLISFDEALRYVLAIVHPIERTETRSLSDAHERVAAQDVTSAIDVPPFDRSAMDGYAVRAVDLRKAEPAAPVALRCVDRVLTGQISPRTLGPGECIEIATGAPLPAGADAVVIVERTTRSGDLVTIAASIASGQNVGRRGADVARTGTVLRAGDLLTPARIGALAATGVTTIDVYARPSVAIFVTGNEVVDPSRELPPGHVYDVNSFTLRAIVERHGGAATALPPVGDDIDALRAALRAAAAHDLIVCSGGSSVGSRDLLIDALEGIGAVTFHGVAMKPGKPTLFGSIGRTPLLGLPGNPTSCLSNAYLLLVPFLRATARLPAWRPTQMRLPLARALASPSDRHQFFTVRIVDGHVEPAFKSSGDITSMAGADGFIEIPSDSGEMPVGTPVTVTLFQSE